MQPLEGRKPDIEYPCDWSYQVIGLDEQQVRQAVAEVVGDMPHKMKSGNVSSGGKYISVGLELRVCDEKERLQIFQRLSAHPSIRFVI